MTNPRSLAFLALLASGCVGTEVDETDLGEETAEIGVNCPPNAPPCACLLVGTPACADPDGDGLLSIDDNCDWTPNPDQADCDGDLAGDACDGDNVVVTTRLESSVVWITSDSSCIGTRYDLPGINGELRYTTYRHDLYTTRAYCGPSGSNTTTSQSTSYSQQTCYRKVGLSCPYTDVVPTPSMLRCN